jgi:hypothetical protein
MPNFRVTLTGGATLMVTESTRDEIVGNGDSSERFVHTTIVRKGEAAPGPTINVVHVTKIEELPPPREPGIAVWS